MDWVKDVLLRNYQVHRVSREACRRPWGLEMHMLWALLLCWTELLGIIGGYGPASDRNPPRLPHPTAVYDHEPD